MDLVSKHNISFSLWLDLDVNTYCKQKARRLISKVTLMGSLLSQHETLTLCCFNAGPPPVTLAQPQNNPSKHETLVQRWFTVGPPSTPLAQQ